MRENDNKNNKNTGSVFKFINAAKGVDELHHLRLMRLDPRIAHFHKLLFGAKLTQIRYK
jgi:hypothetical protein